MNRQMLVVSSYKAEANKHGAPCSSSESSFDSLALSVAVQGSAEQLIALEKRNDKDFNH